MAATSGGYRLPSALLPSLPAGAFAVSPISPTSTMSSITASTSSNESMYDVPKTPESMRRGRRLKWLSRSKADLKEAAAPRMPRAWIAGHKRLPPYDVTALVFGHAVSELWDDTGGIISASQADPDTFVHLFPPASGRGASIRLHSASFAASSKLVEMARASLDQAREVAKLSESMSQLHMAKPPGRPTHVRHDSAWDDTNREIHLYLPAALSVAAQHGGMPSEADINTLVDLRNVFAFLLGQSLVATDKRPTLFDLFRNISLILQAFEFANPDGSTFGDLACNSFDIYVEELGLANIKGSKELAVEALVLGEAMRSVLLYNEAFVHAVGMHAEMKQAKLPILEHKLSMLSSTTRNRLERASINLESRQKVVENRLSAFDFSSIFAGVINSKTVDERKVISFDAWKASFAATRKWLLLYLKAQYGAWPPKASKVDAKTGGLNRIVLGSLYANFSSAYNLYVDRTQLTTRSHGSPYSGEDQSSPMARIMRRVCDEFDRSSPPVQPPVPYDLPIIPNLSHLPSAIVTPVPQDAVAKWMNKKIPPEELQAVLDFTVNQDALTASPFVAALRQFEAKQAKGCSMVELCDLRAGMWIFIYIVIQSLPLLVIDAPEVSHPEGVEYFLCERPRSGIPWAKQGADSATVRGWYSVSGGNGIVSLPSDLVEHSVDSVYRQSHCWLAAAQWSAEQDPQQMPTIDEELGSPQRRLLHRSSVPVLGSSQSPGLSIKRSSNNLGARPRSSGSPQRSPASRRQSRENLAGGQVLRPQRSAAELVIGPLLEQMPIPRGQSTPDGSWRGSAGMAPGSPRQRSPSRQPRQRPESSSWSAADGPAMAPASLILLDEQPPPVPPKPSLSDLVPPTQFYGAAAAAASTASLGGKTLERQTSTTFDDILSSISYEKKQGRQSVMSR